MELIYQTYIYIPTQFKMHVWNLHGTTWDTPIKRVLGTKIDAWSSEQLTYPI